MPWTPGTRKQARALETPFDDVPIHLRQPLWQWINAGIETPYEFRNDRMQELALRLRIHLGATDGSAVQQLIAKCNQNSDFMLDLVEAMLELYGTDGGRALRLEKLLVAANSAYAVNPTLSGLVLRVGQGVQEALQQVIDDAPGSPGDHLTTAWNEAYSRQADPVKSYSESIKAAEAALATRVSPQNARQTLGTMIRDIEQKPSKWTFVLGDVETVLGMMQSLWQGQTSRHGGTGTTRAETLDEAKAAVLLAAALVQYGVSGVFDTA